MSGGIESYECGGSRSSTLVDENSTSGVALVGGTPSADLGCCLSPGWKER